MGKLEPRHEAQTPYRCAHARPCFTIFLISGSICYAEDRDLVPYIESVMISIHLAMIRIMLKRLVASSSS
jgi:hypothetical protein